MNIAIIGGAGFIGSYVSRILNSNGIKFKILDIVEPDQFKETWMYCDVKNLDSLLKGLVDITHIINLAAEHKDNVSPVSLYYDVNVEGAKNVCNAATRLSIKKIIFTSSVAVYGFVEHETDESGVFNPFNHYGISKLKAEEVYDSWQKKDDSNGLTIIRPTVVFGIGNRGNVYNLFKQISSGKFVMIGPGNNKKSMAYVENVASFIIYAIDMPIGSRVFNYADKPDYSMNELTKLISDVLGKKITPFRIPYFLGLGIGYFVDLFSRLSKRKFSISSVRIKKFCASTQFKSVYINETGFTPPIDIKDAVMQTVISEFIK